MGKSYEKALLSVGILYEEFIPDNDTAIKTGNQSGIHGEISDVHVLVSEFLGKAFSKIEQALTSI